MADFTYVYRPTMAGDYVRNCQMRHFVDRAKLPIAGTVACSGQEESMNIEEVPAFREVNEGQFVELYNSAAAAVRRAGSTDVEDRWAVAAQATCRFIEFLVEEEALWNALHEAVDAENYDEVIEVQERLHEFIDIEYDLLIRRGVSEGETAQITNTIANALIGLRTPTHDELDDARAALEDLMGRMCADVADWADFSQPERRARVATNTNAVVGGAGGLLGATANAVALAIPVFVAGSILGGIASGIAAFRSFRRPH